MKKIISTPHAPAAIGPYSQAVFTEGVLYTAGQIAIVPETGELDLSNITAETHQVMKNLEAVLSALFLHFGLLQNLTNSTRSVVFRLFF